MITLALIASVIWLFRESRKQSRQVDDLNNNLSRLRWEFVRMGPSPEPAPAPAPAPALAPAQAPVRTSTPAPVSTPAAVDAPDPMRAQATPDPPLATPSSAATQRWEQLWRVNVPAKLGILISFIGFALLLKLAVDKGWLSFPIELRLLAVGLSGLAFVILGWHWRDSHRQLGRALQGGGLATLSLTIYSAVLVFDLLSPIVGFLLVTLVTVGAGLLSSALSSRSLAILGIVGGLAAPLLLPMSGVRLTAVFSYYVLFSAATLWLAWRKQWPELNLFAFLGVFGSSFLWMLNYWADPPSGAEIVLVVLAALYVAILVVSHLRRDARSLSAVERVLLLGVPSTTLAMMLIFTGVDGDALGLRSLLMGLTYAVLAWWVFVTHRASGLAAHFAALGCGLVMLAVPLALEASAVSAIWALSGLLQVLIGSRQESRGYLFSGIALQFAAGLFCAIHLFSAVGPPFLNGAYLGAAWVAFASLLSAWVLDQARDRNGWLSAIGWVPFCWGALWWIGATVREIHGWVPVGQHPTAFLIVVILSAGAAYLFDRWRRWPKLDQLVPLWGFGLIGVLLTSFGRVQRPSDAFGWLIWPLAGWVYWLWVRRSETRQGSPFPIGYGILHGLFLALACWELHQRVASIADGIWPLSIVAMFIAIVGLARWTPALSRHWPLGPARSAYVLALPIVNLVVALLLVFALQLTAGNPAPQPFLPLLNPVDLASILTLLLLASVTREKARKEGFGWILVLAWAFSSLTVLRCVHAWADVAFRVPSMLASMTAQTSLTVYWSILGLVGMVLGTHRSLRLAWNAGAVTMGLVVAKLFLIDLAGVNTSARIVSFLGAGGLLLLIGYLAPQPPKLRVHDESIHA